ncbi:DUF6531 domain-containing protein, partial [Luteimonas gilva]
MDAARINYESRLGHPWYSTEYRCVRQGANAFVGEIWLRSCVDCAYFWSHGYGLTEWPIVSFAPAKNRGCPSSSCSLVGNPINMATGNKYQREADFSVSALLSFERYYNSQGAFQSYGLGDGWTHSYSKRVEYSSSTDGGLVAKVHRPSGGYTTFFKQQTGGWVSDPDATDTLSAVVDGSVQIGWKFTEGSSQNVETYDLLGRMVSLVTQSGEQINLEYNGGDIDGNARDLLLTKITDRAGRLLRLHYDSASRLDQMTDPAGRTYNYAYDAADRLSSVSYPGSSIRTYSYNESAHTSGADLPLALTGIVDESSQRYATFRYDVTDRAISTEHAGGVDKFQVAYSGNTYATVTDPLGNPQYRNFDTYSGVKRLTYQLNQCSTCPTSATTFSYDAAGRLNTVTDFLGNIADHDRGATDDLETQLIEAKTTTRERKTQTDWNTSLRKPVERRIYDAFSVLIAKSTWTYNARGQALTVSQIDPATATTRTTTTTYCEAADITSGTCPLLGLATSVDGPRTDVSDTTTYTYYASDDASCASAPTTCPHRKGDLWKVTDALGRVTETLAYDGAGRVLSVKDANNVVTDFTYHPRGWLTARKVRGTNNASEADDQITAIEYWPTGLVKKVTQPDGAFTAYTYDAAHRLTDIAD